MDKTPKHLTISEFNQAMRAWNEFFAEFMGPIDGVIVYKESNWEDNYPLAARSYMVSSAANKYDSSKISRSLFGSALDGSDKGVRLDYYDWEVDYCYFPYPKTETNNNN